MSCVGNVWNSSTMLVLRLWWTYGLLMIFMIRSFSSAPANGSLPITIKLKEQLASKYGRLLKALISVNEERLDVMQKLQRLHELPFSVLRTKEPEVYAVWKLDTNSKSQLDLERLFRDSNSLKTAIVKNLGEDIYFIIIPETKTRKKKLRQEYTERLDEFLEHINDRDDDKDIGKYLTEAEADFTTRHVKIFRRPKENENIQSEELLGQNFREIWIEEENIMTNKHAMLPEPTGLKIKEFLRLHLLNEIISKTINELKTVETLQSLLGYQNKKDREPKNNKLGNKDNLEVENEHNQIDSGEYWSSKEIFQDKYRRRSRHFGDKCNEKAAKACTRACKTAFKEVCYGYKYAKSAKSEFAEECRRSCRLQFIPESDLDSMEYARFPW